MIIFDIKLGVLLKAGFYLYIIIFYSIFTLKKEIAVLDITNEKYQILMV